jgi:hypothetical protein
MKIYASTTDGLLNMFCYNTDEAVGKYNNFAIKNVKINVNLLL